MSLKDNLEKGLSNFKEEFSASGLTHKVKNVVSDVGSSYQDVLLQDSPLQYHEAEQWKPETGTPLDPKKEQGTPLQPIEGEPLEPFGGGVTAFEPKEGMIIDGEYSVMGEKSELPPPPVHELPAPDESLGLESPDR
jgi:hypothetical protein